MILYHSEIILYIPDQLQRGGMCIEHELRSKAPAGRQVEKPNLVRIYKGSLNLFQRTIKIVQTKIELHYLGHNTETYT